MPQSVVLVEPGLSADAQATLRATVTTAEPFVAVPAFFADTGDPGLAPVAKMEGVVAVTNVDDDTMGVVAGVDRFIAGMTGLLHGWEVGGVAPGEWYPPGRPEVHGIAAPPAVCVAVNMSIAPHDDDVAPTLPGDVVNHATKALSVLATPVIAAGNHHTLGAEFETVSPWAEPEWVLSVGATDDEAGTREWERSARGSALRPDVGPDVLAWGQDACSPEFGTSFAAARVSGMLVVVGAFLLHVRANIYRARGRPWGVPLVGLAILDRGIHVDEIAPRRNLPALPVEQITLGAFDGFGDAQLDELAAACGPSAIAAAAKRLLLAAAAETSSGQGLSAPVIREASLVDWLQAITARRLHGLLRQSDVAAGPGNLFPEETVARIWADTHAAQPIWFWNFRTQRGLFRRTEGENE